jgi:hypothetical protein
MGHKGRSLEELVFNLERMLASESALIRSPDFIQGKNSGVTREVDISIRAKVGSADLLVIVECRDRNSKQDVRWIEELSSKQIDVQANKVIAVSRRGFTEAAISAARNLNIDLRTFDSIDAKDLATWVTFRVPTFIRHRLDACTLHFDKLEIAGNDPKSFIESLRIEALPIIRLTDGKVVAIQEIMSDLQRTGDHVPQTQISRWPDGFSISVDTSRYKYVIDGQDGQCAYLTRIDLAGDFTAGIDILTPHLDKRYVDGNSTLSLIAETIVTGPRGPVTISAKANADRSRFHIHVSCGDEVGELLLDENGKLIESRSGHSAHEVQSRSGAGSTAQDR